MPGASGWRCRCRAGPAPDRATPADSGDGRRRSSEDRWRGRTGGRPMALAAWASASSQLKKASLLSRASQLSRLSPMASCSVPLDGLIDDVLAVDQVTGGRAAGDAARQHVRRWGHRPPKIATSSTTLRDTARVEAPSLRARRRFDVRAERGRRSGVDESGVKNRKLWRRSLWTFSAIRHRLRISVAWGGTGSWARRSSEGGGIQAGRAADAAHPRGDHEAVLGRAADQELLEAAEQGADAAGVDDAVAVQVHLEPGGRLRRAVQIDVEGGAGHGGVWSPCPGS